MAGNLCRTNAPKLGCAILLAATFAGACKEPTAPTAQHPPVRVIFDTDMDTDVDDVGALAILHAMADHGEVTVLATMVSSYHPWSAPAVDAINTYFGRPNLLIGVPNARSAGRDFGSRFARQIAESFENDIVSNDQAPDAVAEYRRVLARQPDTSVVIVTVGYLTNLSDLLRSAPDQHSPLTGRELVLRKVKHYVAMAGSYPADLNPAVWGNFKPFPDAAVHVAREWPSKITFSGGGAFANQLATGGRLASEALPDSPVRRAYELYFGGRAQNRHSADQIAVLVAVRGTGTPWQLVTRGYNHVFDNGTHEWRNEPDEPRHQFVVSLAEGIKPDDVARTIEDMMMHPPRTRP
jgi:hypothetical protein